jgi:hypothetical protein
MDTRAMRIHLRSEIRKERGNNVEKLLHSSTTLVAGVFTRLRRLTEYFVICLAVPIWVSCQSSLPSILVDVLGLDIETRGLIKLTHCFR